MVAEVEAERSQKKPANQKTNAKAGDKAQTELVRLKGLFTPAAKQRINEFLASFETFVPTLALLYGNQTPNITDKAPWSLMAINEQLLADTVELYARFGAVVCYELDGFKVIVPQIAHISGLDSGTLEFKGDRLGPVSTAGD